MRRVTRRAWLAAGVALPGALVRPATALADDLADLKKARAATKTLVATFQQERKVGLLKAVVKSDGELTLVAPSQLRWELFTDKVVYFVGPSGFSMRSPSGTVSVGKAAAGKFGAVLDDLLALIAGDFDKLRPRYDLAAVRADGVTITLRPKTDDGKKLVRSIELATGADLAGLSRIVLVEAGGDTSTIRFSKVTKDAKVDPGKMKP